MAELFFQEWLDEVAAAFFDERFDLYENAVSLPLEIVSERRASTIGTQDGLKLKFDQWVSMMQTHRVTDMIRIARGVTRLSPDRIVGDYDTEILSNGARVMPAFSSSMMLEKQGNIWRAVRVTTGMTQDQWPLFFANTKIETDGSGRAS
ncbi:hypothetical protein [Yoonia algicola]|uniref:Uncharacterized protein n=1 Tax=Yoonia algicola TaxID=3137368 RepID=A0AAN0M2T5_9RHOB